MVSRRGQKNAGKETKFAMVHFYKKGINQAAIAKHFGIPKTRVSMILKKLMQSKLVQRKKVQIQVE